MSVRTTHEKSVRRYIMAIALFILVGAVSLSIFLVGLYRKVEQVVEREIWETMARQSDHIDFSFDIRFQHLESAADFLGKQEDIQGETARQYIQSLTANSTMQHVAIYDTEGNGIFDNGEIYEDVSREYIRLALAGQRSVSDLARSVVDGELRFYLSVPIRRGEETVGALSGSFNIDELGTLLFSDSYEGQSVMFIAERNGRVIYSDEAGDGMGLQIPNDLFEELRQGTMLDGGTAEEVIARLERLETGMTQYRQAGGESLFLLYMPIADSSLLLLHAIPHDLAYRELGSIESSVVTVGVVLLLSVLALVLFLVLSSTHSQRSLVKIAQTDPLTGLYNKQYTQESVDMWLRSEGCTGTQAMLFIDIDYFKQINDTYGHSIGDDALRFVSQALRQEFRSSDIIGRIGGDEFLVFMRNVPVRQVVRTHAASLSRRLKTAEIEGLDKGVLHCSIGIAYSPDHGSTYHGLTLYADKALYQTKERGRDGFTEYNEALYRGGAENEV